MPADGNRALHLLRSPAINIDDTALVEVMAAISNTFEAFMVIAACRLRFGIAA